MKVYAEKAEVYIPSAILSYPQLVHPASFVDGGEAKYSATFLVQKEDGNIIEMLEPVFLNKMREKLDFIKTNHEQKLRSLYGSGNRFFIKDGDLEGRPETEGRWIVKSKSKDRPSLFDNMLNKVEEEQIASVFYPGCIVNAKLSIFVYNYKGSWGISSSMKGIQFAGHGVRLAASHVADASEFEAVPLDQNLDEEEL